MGCNKVSFGSSRLKIEFRFTNKIHRYPHVGINLLRLFQSVYAVLKAPCNTIVPILYTAHIVYNHLQ